MSVSMVVEIRNNTKKSIELLEKLCERLEALERVLDNGNILGGVVKKQSKENTDAFIKSLGEN